jgi:hypothetical protein
MRDRPVFGRALRPFVGRPTVLLRVWRLAPEPAPAGVLGELPAPADESPELTAESTSASRDPRGSRSCSGRPAFGLFRRAGRRFPFRTPAPPPLPPAPPDPPDPPDVELAVGGSPEPLAGSDAELPPVVAGAPTAGAKVVAGSMVGVAELGSGEPRRVIGAGRARRSTRSAT